MVIRSIAAAFSALTVVCFPVFAFTPETVLSKSEISVGEPLDYIITLRTAGSLSVSMPEKRTYLLKEVSGLKKGTSSADESQNADLPAYSIDDVFLNEKDNIKEAHIVLRYFTPGSFVMPRVSVKDEKGAEISLNAPSVTVKAVNEKGELADIEDPLSLGGNYTRLILLIIGAAVLGALIFALIRYIRKKKYAVSVPDVPAIDIFRTEAALLDAGLADGTIDAGGYAVKISSIVRVFLSKKYCFSAADMTNPEIIAYLRTLYNDKVWLNKIGELEDLSMLWDMSKFAEFVPSADILRINLKRISGLCEKMWAE